MDDIAMKHSKLKDATKAKAILDKYEWGNIRLYVDEDNALALEGNMDDRRIFWPLAILKDKIPADLTEMNDLAEDFFERLEARADLFNKKGGKGFLAVLRALSPLLVERLDIMVLVLLDGECRARIWTVEPRGAVEMLETHVESE